MKAGKSFPKALLLAVCALLLAGNASSQEVKLNASAAGPREMQQATRQSIARAYGNAWKTLGEALANNGEGVLDAAFAGAARDKFAQLIRQQQATGLRQRYVDRGHQVEVLFYSPDGVSVQLRDRAQLELQVLDGDSVIHREQVTVNYLALLTPTEVTWKVRLLQAVPE